MADNSIPITAGTGTSVRTVTNAAVDSGAHQQVVTLSDTVGNLIPTDPDGTLQVDAGVSTLIFEAFDGTLANQWTTGGTAPTQANGALTFLTVTTAGATSYITSINPLPLSSESYLHTGWVLALDTVGAQTNNTRWWGYGQNATTPAAGAPVLNGAVFLLDYNAGVFYAAIFSAGTRTQAVTLTKPTDGLNHRYQIQFRTSRAYFLIDGVTVATITNPNTAVSNNLFLIAGSANFTSGPSATPTMVASSASAADSNQNNQTLSDGTFQSVRASIKKASVAPVATDTALVVGLSPNSPLPTGSNTVGSLTNLAAITTSITPGTSATQLGKARSSAGGTTDTGIAALGLRAPATPVANASAAGAYSHMLVDAEAKTIIAGSADPVNNWQATVGVASTSQTLLKAAAATGLRNYITELTITSTVTAFTVVTIQDGSTVIWQAAVSLTSPVSISFRSPLKGTAATAVNITSLQANQVYVSTTGYVGI